LAVRVIKILQNSQETFKMDLHAMEFTSNGFVGNSYLEILLEDYTALNINIYELAHKCKVWAHTNNRELLSGIHNNIGYCEIRNLNRNNPHNKLDHYANTEPKAIFAACQWILENLDDNPTN